jgi:hypothetical protein
VLENLTGPEQALVDVARHGRELVCARGTEIRAELVRELLLGKHGELVPSGVRLRGATLTGSLDLEHVTAATGLSLAGCDITAPVLLASATVPWLVLAEAEVHTTSGHAVDATRLRVAGVLDLRGARMSGHGEDGVIVMHGAHVGEVEMRRVALRNDTGPGLHTTNLTVDGNMFLDHAEVSGHGEKGALRLSGARITGLLVLDDADITNPAGPGLRADGIHVGGELKLHRARVSGTGDLGAISLRAARVAYDIHVVDSVVCNDSGPSLFADQLEISGMLLLEGTRLTGVVRLAAARVGGQFSLSGTPIDELDVNDFGYGSLAGVDWQQWLALIRDHIREYRPSPYQRLAAVERAARHDGNARNILISQQHDLRHRAPHALGGRLTRWFHWLWGALAGYGYRARRTALALLIALMAAGAVSLWAGHVPTGPGRHAAEHTAATGAPGTPCSTVELVGLGLDRGLPLGPTGLRSRCDLDTGTAAGQVFTVLLWVVQAAVWGLATLALAGYTGLIRKTA